jgi:2,3-bisphosphoglycerate-independent phosphoglycerate mutase
MGLVQDQGVHATEEHLYALLELARRRDFERVFVHFFSDGRDTPPRSALTYLERLEARMGQLGLGSVATVMGRYYAMDRDTNWDRIRMAYDALTRGKGFTTRSAREAIESAYARADEALEEARARSEEPEGVVETDEFIKPTVIVGDDGQPLGLIKPTDSVIFFNYRQDRAVELTRAFVEKDFGEPGFPRGAPLDIYYLGLTRYYDSFEQYVIPPMNMSNILGEVLAGRGLWQLRISETQKFRHVTSFFNSKREEPFEGEDRILIDSPKVPEETKPEMSAYEVTEIVIEAVTGGIAAVRQKAEATPQVTLFEAPPLAATGDRLEDTYDVIVLNYVNGDMVGHTGVFEAAVKAIEAVDECVGNVVEAVLARGGICLVTADHGNAEQMIDAETRKPQTAHTTNQVDFIYVAGDTKGVSLRPQGVLSDIAPTMLEILGVKPPAEMTAHSLFL